MHPTEYLVAVGTLVTSVAAFLGAVWAGVRKVWPVIKKVETAVDDFNGEAARPGVPRRPGMMERVAATEEAVVKVEEMLEASTGSLGVRLDQMEAVSAENRERIIRLESHGHGRP